MPVTVTGLLVPTLLLANVALAYVMVRASPATRSSASATVAFADDRVAGDALTITYASATFANKSVGTNKPVTVTGIAINGADKNNYIVSLTTTATADITQRTLVVSGTG